MDTIRLIILSADKTQLNYSEHQML